MDDVDVSKFKLEVVSLYIEEEVSIVVSLFKIELFDVELNVQTSKNTNATPNIKVLSIILWSRYFLTRKYFTHALYKCCRKEFDSFESLNFILKSKFNMFLV